MRSLLVVLALFAPLAGCASEEGDGARLAVPTKSPIVVPTDPSPVRPTSQFNYSDPGYAMPGAWRVGDAWDYESNQSHLLRVRVIDQRSVSGLTTFLVETKLLKSSGALITTNRSWVEGRTWTVLNATDEAGVLTKYQPTLPLRHFRNGSYTYNVTRFDDTGTQIAREVVGVQSRLYATHQTIQFSWGYVEAKRVEEYAYTRAPDGSVSSARTMRYVHADYLHDLQVDLPSGEVYKLTAARAGELRRGTIAP